MKRRILIATEKPFAKEALTNIEAILSEAGFEIDLLERYIDRSELFEKIATVDGAIIRSDLFDEAVFDKANQLKVLVRAGAGYDNIDLVAATAHGVCVMNTPGQNANAVAELAFGLTIYVIRNFYEGTSGFELLGKKIGIHAYGNVGRNVARIAKGFGMDVCAFDPFIPNDVIKKEGVQALDCVEELYSMCQFVSLHIPATTETIKSINYNLLKRMPKNAVLINTARKEVINESDLLKMFSYRTDFKYVTDVLPYSHLEFVEKYNSRYFSTAKKSGAQTEEANLNAGVAAASQIVSFFNEGIEQFRVNR